MTKKAAAARKAGAARRLEAAARDQKVSLVRAPGASTPATSASQSAPSTSATAAKPASAPKPATATAPRPAVKRPAAPPPPRAIVRSASVAAPRARTAPAIEQQYAYVKGDLRLIAALAALMFVVIIALHFYLPS
jgi:hypothetical protein